MTTFIMEYGKSRTPQWTETLKSSDPPVYHVDVVVSTGSKVSEFVIGSAQIERVSEAARWSFQSTSTSLIGRRYSVSE